MKLVKITGPLTQLSNFISACCVDGNFQPEQAAQYMSATMGYTSLNEENPYAPTIQKIEELIRENDSAPNPSIVGIGSREIVPDEKTKEYIDELDKGLSAIHDERKVLRSSFVSAAAESISLNISRALMSGLRRCSNVSL